MATRSSLWRIVPRATRLQLIPILTTLVLVQAGATTAELIVRGVNGTPFGQPAHTQSVADIQGILLLLNLVVVLWFGRRALKDATAKAGHVSLDTKVIGLGTAFATGLELYEYATKSGHPERLVLALLLLFYVFVVPFFLLKGPVPGKDDAGDGRWAAEQASATLELLLYALVPCVGSALAGSVYYAVLNGGLKIAGEPIVPSITALWASPYGLSEFWCFNPAFLGVGWLMVVTLCAVRKALAGTLCLDRAGRILVVLATAVISVFLGLLLIGDSSIIAKPQGLSPSLLAGAKAGVAIVVLMTFSIAFSVSRAAAKLPTVAALLVQTLLFAAAGAVTGYAVVELRAQLGGGVSSAAALIALHAVGYAIALLAGRGALTFIEARFPEIHPILKANSRASGPPPQNPEASLFWDWRRQ